MKRRDEVLVGLLLSVAIAVLVLGALWLARGGLASGYALHSRFPWGQNLKQGQPVLLAGVNVGYVDDVRLRNGGYLDVMYRIEDEYQIPRSSQATVIAVGIFGDVAIALTPKDASGPFYQPGDTVPTGPSAPGISQIISKVDSITATVNVLTTALNQELVATGGLRDIRRTLASTQQLTAQLGTIAAQQNRNMNATFASLQRTTDNVNRAIDPAVIDSTLRNFRAASANIDRLTSELTGTTTQLSAVLTKLERGEGTAGKLLSDTLLYRDLRNLVGRVDSLTADFKRNPRKYINLEIF
ncbi:MAG TPA: MlaD family protein [Gemmatimonadaceae bacterium]|nr:MlaD family protein [Gemmatimonadaceae bacterium]